MLNSRAVVFFEPDEDVRTFLSVALTGVVNNPIFCKQSAEIVSALDEATDYASSIVLVADFFENPHLVSLLNSLQQGAGRTYRWNNSVLAFILMIGYIDDEWEAKLPQRLVKEALWKPFAMDELKLKLERSFQILERPERPREAVA